MHIKKKCVESLHEKGSVMAALVEVCALWVLSFPVFHVFTFSVFIQLLLDLVHREQFTLFCMSTFCTQAQKSYVKRKIQPLIIFNTVSHLSKNNFTSAMYSNLLWGKWWSVLFNSCNTGPLVIGHFRRDRTLLEEWLTASVNWTTGTQFDQRLDTSNHWVLTASVIFPTYSRRASLPNYCDTDLGIKKIFPDFPSDALWLVYLNFQWFSWFTEAVNQVSRRVWSHWNLKRDRTSFGFCSQTVKSQIDLCKQNSALRAPARASIPSRARQGVEAVSCASCSQLPVQFVDVEFVHKDIFCGSKCLHVLNYIICLQAYHTYKRQSWGRIIKNPK